MDRRGARGSSDLVEFRCCVRQAVAGWAAASVPGKGDFGAVLVVPRAPASDPPCSVAGARHRCRRGRPFL
eukprot:5516234-Lingulodinium_polyedra.AAC.1